MGERWLQMVVAGPACCHLPNSLAAPASTPTNHRLLILRGFHFILREICPLLFSSLSRRQNSVIWLC